MQFDRTRLMPQPASRNNETNPFGSAIGPKRQDIKTFSRTFVDRSRNAGSLRMLGDPVGATRRGCPNDQSL
jgi:hypothetical protein